jgi:phosphate transport system permease protein
MKQRVRTEKIVKIFCLSFAVAASIVLFLIIGTIFIGAIPSLTPYFLLTPESATPRIGMGILNAIIGTIILSLSATLLAMPLALGTAIHLQRYARQGRLTRVVRFFIEVLSGTPSIVIGMFGFLIFVYYMKVVTGGYSLLSGSVALAILIMPAIERAAEDAIATVHKELEEGSYALGASKWQTIREVTLPAALPGLFTATILGFGRAAEESAVVILTAGYTQYMPELAIKSHPGLLFGVKIYPVQDLVASLPYAVYHAYENSNVIPLSNGFAAAFVLICVVLVINLAARTVIHLGMNRGKGFSIPCGLTRHISMLRVDRVVEPAVASQDDTVSCPFRELEQEEGERLMAKGKEKTQGKWGQGP